MRLFLWISILLLVWLNVLARIQTQVQCTGGSFPRPVALPYIAIALTAWGDD